jgi:hypothetical protein
VVSTPLRVKQWEIIADNLKKAGSSMRYVQRWIVNGERSGLLTHIVRTESVSLFA